MIDIDKLQQLRKQATERAIKLHDALDIYSISPNKMVMQWKCYTVKY